MPLSIDYPCVFYDCEIEIKEKKYKRCKLLDDYIYNFIASTYEKEQKMYDFSRYIHIKESYIRWIINRDADCYNMLESKYTNDAVHETTDYEYNIYVKCHFDNLICNYKNGVCKIVLINCTVTNLKGTNVILFNKSSITSDEIDELCKTHPKLRKEFGNIIEFYKKYNIKL